MGVAPRSDRGGQRDIQPAAEGLRPRRADPRGLRVAYVAGRWRARRGDAWRRDDRRGEPQDGARDRRQGQGGRHAADVRAVPPTRLIGAKDEHSPSACETAFLSAQLRATLWPMGWPATAP